MDKSDNAVEVVVKLEPGEDKVTYEKRVVVTLLRAMRTIIVNEIRKIPREFFFIGLQKREAIRKEIKRLMVEVISNKQSDLDGTWEIESIEDLGKKQ